MLNLVFAELTKTVSACVFHLVTAERIVRSVTPVSVFRHVPAERIVRNVNLANVPGRAIAERIIVQSVIPVNVFGRAIVGPVCGVRNVAIRVHAANV